jgi:hypothetical protein
MRTTRPSTIIAKLLTALACHGGATSIPLDPIFAFRTLFKLSALCKLNESLIVFIEAIVNSILFAAHSRVKITSAAQAIVLFASRAAIVI